MPCGEHSENKIMEEGGATRAGAPFFHPEFRIGSPAGGQKKRGKKN